MLHAAFGIRGLSYLLTVLVVSCCSEFSFADQTDFLLLGTRHKAVSGAGLTQLSGFEAVATNPSAIGLVGSIPFSSELSVLSLEYAYQYPGEDRATIKIATPSMFMGGTHPLTGRLRLGWSLMPIPGAASKIEAVGVSARILGEAPAKMNVTSENTGVLDYKFATGLSWRANRQLSFGFSLLASKSEVRTIVTDHESDVEIVDLTSRTDSHALLVGTTLTIPETGSKVAASFRSPTSSKLQGKSNREGGSDFSTSSRQAYRLGAGVEQALWQIAMFGEIYFAPRTEDEGVNDPTQLASNGVIARRDTFSYATGLKARIYDLQYFLSYGFVPSAVGDGIMASRDVEKLEFIGVGFGDLTAISRHHVGVGNEYTIGSLRMRSSLSAIQGTRSVPEWSRGYGEYQLRVFTLSTSIDWRF